MSELPEDDERQRRPGLEDELPRQGILSAIPKRTFSRVVLLLAALAGVLYLRQRTDSIAGCMSDAFRIPPPAELPRRSAPIKARVVLPPDASDTLR